MFKSVKQFFGFQVEDPIDAEKEEDQDDFDLNFSPNLSDSKMKTTKPKKTESKVASPTCEPSVGLASQNVGKFGLNEIKVVEPTVYDDSLGIAQDLRQNTPIIVKLHSLGDTESKRLIDFLCGTAYAINGQMFKISDAIFLFTPSTITISQNEAMEKSEETNLYEEEAKKYLYKAEPTVTTSSMGSSSSNYGTTPSTSSYNSNPSSTSSSYSSSY